MLDRLLGRDELDERIEELETENGHLERQLDAERERRADAVTARQEAQERVNRLEDRVADLEGRLEAADDGSASLAHRRRESLRGERLEAVLRRVESVETPGEGALTACVGDASPDALRDLLGSRVALVPDDRAVVFADDAGVVALALVPPLAPEPFLAWDEHFRVEREWFQPAGRHAVALVRADTFALGVYRGRERVHFEGFESNVDSEHSKGGFSQARFERRRDEQVDEHLARCREALDDADLDDAPLYVVGERTLLGTVADDADATRAVDATGDPEAALDDAVRSFWTTRLYAL